MPRTWAVVWTSPEGQYLGSAIVDADTFLAALSRCDKLGIKPGGNARGAAITDYVPPDMRDRFISPNEAGGTIESLSGDQGGGS